MKKGLFLLVILMIASAFVFARGGAESDADDGVFRVAALYQTAIEEPWDGVIHQACLRAVDEYGIEYEFTEQVAAADIEKVLREYSERGFDLIVGDAFLAGEDASRRVAVDYPEINYAFGSEHGPVAPNYSVFDNWIHEPAYLSGIIAGMVTETNILGVVAAIPIAEVNRLVHGFKEGALSVNPDIRVKITYIGGWFDPPKAKEAAQAQIEAGADLIFAERFGVFEAAKENGILAFGNMSDQNSLAPDTVITGPVWDMYPTIEYLIDATGAGESISMNLAEYSMMAKGGASLAPFHGFEEKAAPEVVARVREVEAQIMAGTFTVPVIEEPLVSD